MLDDLKVVELGELVSAPYGAKLLADLGAEVVKVEPPDGDQARREGPFPNDSPHHERSGLFLYLNTNKRGITLDVATPTGRELFLRLVARADVLIENLGPGRIEQLGLTFEQLSETNPRLTMTSISPFGQTGPRRDWRADDLVSFHMSGYGYYLGGAADDPKAEAPLKAAGRQADFVAGVNAALGTIAGVFASVNDGRGQHVDVSVQEALIPFSFGQIVQYAYDGKLSNRRKVDNPDTGVVAVLPTVDGYVAISPREEHLWARWIEVMGTPEWAADDRFKDRATRTANWSELQPLLAEWTSTRTKDEIFRAAQAVRVPAFPVNTIDGVFASPQLAARGFFQEIGHQEAGCALYPTAPYRFSDDGGWRVQRPAPLLGEHNPEVLSGWLGTSPAQLVQMRQAGVI